MTKKEYTARTEFDLWLEKCPVSKWSLRETEYRDHTQVNIRFRIPHEGEAVENSYTVDYRGLDYDA